MDAKRYAAVHVAGYNFRVQLEASRAPTTCAWFQSQLPFRRQVIHARWSGEAVWIPLGDSKIEVPRENQTSYPSRGDVLLYRDGVSEPEILIPYGSATFASRVGQLAGNHFLTVVDAGEELAALGKHVLWSGAQEIEFLEL